MSRNYKFHNPSAAYFVSFATICWVDVFTRQEYFKILAESIDHCRKEKGMELYAYCFMPSQTCPERSRRIHFVFRSANGDPSGLLRDFKKHTSKKVVKAIEGTPAPQ